MGVFVMRGVWWVFYVTLGGGTQRVLCHAKVMMGSLSSTSGVGGGLYTFVRKEACKLAVGTALVAMEERFFVVFR